MGDKIDRTLKNMELISSSKSSVAKFLRIQRSVAALPLLVIYTIVGLYFTGFNFFHVNYLLGALALYLLSVAVNGYNNLFDVEEDKLAISSGIIKANYLLKEFTWRQLKWNLVLTSIALAVVVFLIGNLEFAIICAFTYGLGIIYTRPIRLKNRPFLGTISNTYGFSLLPILSCYFLFNGDLTATIAFSLATVLPTFASCLIAEIADREVDRKIGTRTTACWLGTRLKTVIKAILIFSVVLYFVALLIHWAVVLVTPFLVIILYEIDRLYMDFTDKKADFILLKIGANLSKFLVVYVIAAIIFHETAAILHINIF
ncbi:UbiA prenyltransferase family protein [Candidatus Woesebacteria bacterium]|nr:UbiA prenyltransferase family protein [Candidatus Woesebacteria bacterium]